MAVTFDSIPIDVLRAIVDLTPLHVVQRKTSENGPVLNCHTLTLVSRKFARILNEKREKIQKKNIARAASVFLTKFSRRFSSRIVFEDLPQENIDRAIQFKSDPNHNHGDHKLYSHIHTAQLDQEKEGKIKENRLWKQNVAGVGNMTGYRPRPGCSIQEKPEDLKDAVPSCSTEHKNWPYTQKRKKDKNSDVLADEEIGGHNHWYYVDLKEKKIITKTLEMAPRVTMEQCLQNIEKVHISVSRRNEYIQLFLCEGLAIVSWDSCTFFEAFHTKLLGEQKKEEKYNFPEGIERFLQACKKHIINNLGTFKKELKNAAFEFETKAIQKDIVEHWKTMGPFLRYDWNLLNK